MSSSPPPLRQPSRHPPPVGLGRTPGFGRDVPRYAGELSPFLEHAFLSPGTSSTAWLAAASSQASPKPSASSLSANAPQSSSDIDPLHESSGDPDSGSAGSFRRQSSGDSGPSAGGESATTTTGSSAPLVTTARLREDRRSVSRLMMALAIFSVICSTVIALSMVVHARLDSRLLSDRRGGSASDTTPELEVSFEPSGEGAGAKKHKSVGHKSRPARKRNPGEASTQIQPHFSIETHAPLSVKANSSARLNNRSTGQSLHETVSASQTASSLAKITSSSYTVSSVNATSSANPSHTVSSASKEPATSGISSRDGVPDTSNAGNEAASPNTSSRATTQVVELNLSDAGKGTTLAEAPRTEKVIMPSLKR
ncbi:mucin-1-like [Dermacentor albipictus]|uniref:mucin-1-like n=1 Tax=Dermacentor albipictus TaxID=60249 RepID=UPI0031FE35BF